MTNPVAEKEVLDTKFFIKVGITLFLMFGFRFIPAPNPITPYGMAIIGIFLGLIYSWTVSPNNMMWSSFFGLAALATTQYGNAMTVMANAFGNSSLVLIMFSMMIVGALGEAGLAEWLIAKLISAKFAKGKPWLLTSVLVVGPFLLATLINPMVLIIFLLSLYKELFEKCGYEPTDKYPNMVGIGMVLAILCAPFLFPFKSTMLMFLPVVQNSCGVVFDYAQYMICVIPWMVGMTVLYIPFMKLMGCNPSKMVEADLSDIEEKYSYGLTNYQKSILVVILSYVIGSIAISFLGGPTGFRLVLQRLGVYGWTLIIGGIMMVIRWNNKELLSSRVAPKLVSWDSIMVVASATIISGCLTSADTGVAAWITGTLAPVLSTIPPIMVILLIGLVTFVLTNGMNNLGVAYTMLAVVCSLYNQGLDVNIYIFSIFTIIMAFMAFLLPASSVYGAMLHTSGFCNTGALIKYGVIVMVYVFVVSVAIFFPLANFVYL